MICTNPGEKIEELKAIKKSIVKIYIVLFVFTVAFAISSLIYTRWLMIPFCGFGIGFFREALNLDKVNSEIKLIKISK